MDRDKDTRPVLAGSSFRPDAVVGIAGVLAVLVLAAVFHGFSYWQIAKYYSKHLPHYDSIGGYTFAFVILELMREGAYSAAFARVLGFSLSQTQAFFTFVFSPILDSSPQQLQLYNTACFAALAFSLHLLARKAGASAARAAVVAALPLAADTFSWWQGGLLDWQRDPSFLCLLGAAFFSSFAHAARPGWAGGACAGIFTGLALAARDSSPVFLLAAVGPIYLGWLFWSARAGRIGEQFRWMILPAVACSPLALHYVVFQLLPSVSRFGNAFVAFGLGATPLESATSLWPIPFKLYFGIFPAEEGAMFTPELEPGAAVGLAWTRLAAPLLGTTAPFEAATFLNQIVATGELLLVATAAAFALRPTARASMGLPATLALAGLAAALLSALFLFGIGVRPLTFGTNKHPFYPTLLAFFSVVTASVLCLPRIRMGTSAKWLVVAVINVAIFVVLLARIELRTWPAFAIDREKFGELTRLIAEPGPNGEPKTVAFLWHEGLTLDVIAYYATMRGAPSPRKLHFGGPNGELLDPEIGVPAGVDRDLLWKRFEAAVLACSDLIVVAADPKLYALPRHPLLLYQAGAVFVGRLLENRDGELLRMPFLGTTLIAFGNRRQGEAECHSP